MKNIMSLILMCSMTLPIQAGENPVNNNSRHFFKYLANFSTNNIDCFAQVNGVPIMDNMYSTQGPSFAGSNVGAFLEEGVNEIRLAAAANDDWDKGRELKENSYCKLSFSANTIKEKLEMANLVISPADDLLPSAHKSSSYPAHYQTGDVVAGMLPDSLLYEAKRNIHIKNIPKWAWVDATPVQNTNENINKLQLAYLKLIELYKARDIEKISKEYAMAMEEWAQAEDSSAEIFFASLGIQTYFDRGYKIKEPQWGQYEFLSFLDGRLIQLEGDDSLSPIVLEKDGDEYSYAPFFSLINGEFVIGR